MTPYDAWKTTNIEGERRADECEWIDARADELLQDRAFLQGVAEDDIFYGGDDAHNNTAIELIADIIAMYKVEASRLPGSELLTRLYRHALSFYRCAETAAIEQAQTEFETRSRQAE